MRLNDSEDKQTASAGYRPLITKELTMDIAEYFDSVASYWDDDFAEARPARIVASAVSIPRCGACVLDIGCGSGSMFLDLLENGACEIDGLDLSQNMVEAARCKFGFDPRIHVTQGDFLLHTQPGYDVLMAFNSYQHFPQPRVFLKKAKELLHPGGRLTVAFSASRDRINTVSALLPAGLARGLLSASEEAVFWQEDFVIDCLCDNESLYLISGIAK